MSLPANRALTGTTLFWLATSDWCAKLTTIETGRGRPSWNDFRRGPWLFSEP